MKQLTLIFAFLLLSLGLRSQPRHPSKDPMATTDNQKVDPNKNLDGSGGKYHKSKHNDGKKFIKTRRTKGVKRSSKGREPEKG